MFTKIKKRIEAFCDDEKIEKLRIIDKEIYNKEVNKMNFKCEYDWKYHVPNYEYGDDGDVIDLNDREDFVKTVNKKIKQLTEEISHIQNSIKIYTDLGKLSDSQKQRKINKIEQKAEERKQLQNELDYFNSVLKRYDEEINELKNYKKKIIYDE